MRTNVLPAVGPPIKVSRRVSCTIDVLDLTSNYQAYALTVALTISVGLHLSVALTLRDVQTHQSAQIKYTGFKWAHLTHPLINNKSIAIHIVRYHFIQNEKSNSF